MEKKPENSSLFLRLLAANTSDKKEQDYNHYLGKLENKPTIFRKSRITCGLVPCLPQNKLKVTSRVWGNTFLYFSEEVLGCEFFSF